MKTSQKHKQVYDDFIQHFKRLKWSVPVSETIADYILDNVSIPDIKEVLPYTRENPINIKMLDNEEVYKEVMKFIGLMEASNNEDELTQLLVKRKEIKFGPKDKRSDFNDVMKTIININTSENNKS